MQRNVIWYQWHRIISSKERELTIDEIYEDEKNAGIDYLNALSND